MPVKPLHLAFFGSSLVSSYWNGAATYYRGLIKYMHARGHRITFYEPDAFERQQNRDMPDPPWARSVVYANDADAMRRALRQAREADILIKCSGVGVFDTELEAELPDVAKAAGRKAIFWDVDAPATLERCRDDAADSFHQSVKRYDLILTYGGGPPVVDGYRQLTDAACVPIYNALDPDTHHPVPCDGRFASDLNLLANRLPDREARIEQFFLEAAARLPHKSFLLGGSGWHDKAMAPNVSPIGHVGTCDHNAFNCSPRAVLNVNRESMARFGYSPATRVFEAAGAAACLISDRWAGMEQFLEPDKEVLLADDGSGVADHLADLDPDRAKAIGEAALKRVLAEHTYAHRAGQLDQTLSEVGLV